MRANRGFWAWGLSACAATGGRLTNGRPSFFRFSPLDHLAN